VEFALSRYYYVSLDSAKKSAPVTPLPAWSELRPVDPARKWALKVSLNVMEDSQPEKMKKANEELMAVKAELDQMFEFQAIDRRVYDTRIPKPPKIAGRGP
jgi:mediator of RNA polymerase II transcription subunit 18